ncbi:DNA-binding SARP family transcriptional activator/tetratricopeptide (TPR) repeat protein [Hamadaea flava]|uniref:BTAD domain-containing putative transcriptional regulator n=1 Tax=Hamadaea flava TaxID=1742688 RepID=A0ABV8LNP8_9ACTN|nr:BTAD domain-containing putative transcriptional regulator [Hamadaea flava]MCP2329695.1 DNA-binding SARP family transcriptional activator/tetratricopeptide (TPR) repeat protein [Hamadaea flava]
MSQLRFQILGPTIVSRDGRDLDLGSPKQRTLLVALLLEPRRVLPMRRLLNLLWDDPPTSATANARTYAYGLRKALGPVLHARDGGYLLDVAPADCDLGQFTAEVGAARLARSADDLSAAERHYEKALGMWRGACGEDLPADIPLQHQLVTVTERRAVAVEEYADLRLRQGPDPRLPEELRQALADHPTREGLWALLMRALAAGGDTAGALEAYHRARSELAARLGVDPGAELVDLQRSILAREPAVAGPSATTRSRSVVPHELPARPPVFVGRDAAVAQLLGAVADPGTRRYPVVLGIDGPGGIGKSTLAVELAHRMSERLGAGSPADRDAGDDLGGEIYVDLHGGRSGLRPANQAEVLVRLLRSLGEPEPGHEDLEGLAARWRSLTHGRRLLIVLDNVLDADQVRPLLPNGPGCTVVVTSRRRLADLDLTARQTLSTLDVDAAVRLLKAHGDADEGPLRQIALLCGGLPLALRMAAARLASRTDLTVGDFALRLSDDRLRLSELGYRDTGVRATFRSSFVALAGSADPVDRDAAKLFCLLGLLPVSDCSAEVAYALIDAAHGDASVGRLVELHLVTSDNGRLRLHDLLRLFAREVADELPPEDIEPAIYRAAWCYAESARRAWLCVRPLAGRMLPPSPLTRAAAADPQTRAEGVRWLAENSASMRELLFALPGLPSVPLSVGVEILRHLTSHDGLAGTFRDTVAVAGRVVEQAAAGADPRAELIARRLLAINLQRLRRYPESQAEVRPAIELLPEVDDPVERITTLNTFGIFQTEWGDLDAAEQSLRAGLKLAREHDDPPWTSLLLHSLGMHQRVRGVLGESIELLREAYGIRQALADEIGQIYTRMQLGKALSAAGEVTEGLAHLDRALLVAERLNSAELAREIRIDRMEVLSRAGRIGEASGELRAALEVCRRLDDETLRAEVLREAQRLRVPA